MKYLGVFIFGILCLIAFNVSAGDLGAVDISEIISEKEFSLYKNVGEFIQLSPRVTVVVQSEASDIAEYGDDVVRSLTGSDCDRDGEMDDNSRCSAIYLKLWLKYKH